MQVFKDQMLPFSMLEVYQPPSTTDSSTAQERDYLLGKQKLWCWLKWISFGLMLLIPINGIFASVIAFQRVFAELSETGTADPSKLANQVSVVILTVLWAFLFALPFLLLWIFARVRHKKWKKSTVSPALNPEIVP